MSIQLRIVAMVLGFGAVAAGGQSTFPFCQIVDGTDYPAWDVEATYTAPADVRSDAGRNIAFWALRGGGGLFYRATGSGDVSLGGRYDVWFADGGGGVALPDALAALRLEAGWTLRWWDGRALQLTLRPGLYTDAADWSSKDVFYPFEALGIRAVNPRVSALLGLAVYPGFDRAFDPRFGFRYAPADSIRLDLMYPETRLTYRPMDWEVALGVRHEAVREFRLEESDPRRLVALRDTRIYLAAAWTAAGALRVTAEAGRVLNREIDFERVETVLDVEDSWYVQLGVGGVL